MQDSERAVRRQMRFGRSRAELVAAVESRSGAARTGLADAHLFAGASTECGRTFSLASRSSRFSTAPDERFVDNCCRTSKLSSTGTPAVRKLFRARKAPREPLQLNIVTIYNVRTVYRRIRCNELGIFKQCPSQRTLHM